MTITIRTVQLTDYEDLAELMQELGYPTTPSDLENRFKLLQDHEDYEALVAVKDGCVIAFAGLCKAYAFEFTGMYVRLLAFVVSSKQRNKGIGKLMLKACENWAMEKGAAAITLNSGNREERKAAHGLYKKNCYLAKSIGFSKKLESFELNKF